MHGETQVGVGVEWLISLVLAAGEGHKVCWQCLDDDDDGDARRAVMDDGLAWWVTYLLRTVIGYHGIKASAVWAGLGWAGLSGTDWVSFL